MRIAFATIGSLLIVYVLLRYESGHKRISNFFDELWIKIDDGVLHRQHTYLTWIDKTKIISLRIIDVFFEKQFFSCKNFLSSLVFIKMTMCFQFVLLCTTFVFKYGASLKTYKSPYGLSFFIPFFDEVVITPLFMSFDVSSAWHVCFIALLFLLFAIYLLLIRFIIHKYSLWIGAIIATVLTLFAVCYRWNKTGSFVEAQDQIGNVLSIEFTPYSIGVKVLINVIDLIIMPSILMIIVYVLRRIFYTQKTLHYVIRLISAIILGYLLFCYSVLFGFLAHLQGWQWVVGCADFLPEIFAPVATLAIMILVAIGMIILLIGLLFFANRIVYIIPKYRIFENDKAILFIGVIMICISLSEKNSIKEILKVIIDRL